MHPARSVLLPGVFFGAAIASGCAHAQGSGAPSIATPTTSAADSDTGIAVYALSRGKGVPEAARRALEAARAELARWGAEGRVIDLVDAPVGFEGDTRLCARFATPADAARALARLREIARGVDLFRVRQEPCAGAPRSAQ
jgi:hypothetical protein